MSAFVLHKKKPLEEKKYFEFFSEIEIVKEEKRSQNSYLNNYCGGMI